MSSKVPEGNVQFGPFNCFGFLDYSTNNSVRSPMVCDIVSQTPLKFVTMSIGYYPRLVTLVQLCF